MDKSFQQRRLVEGKSTENIFSLRRIIEEAHGAHGAVDNRTGLVNSEDAEIIPNAIQE